MKEYIEREAAVKRCLNSALLIETRKKSVPLVVVLWKFKKSPPLMW